jgi:predicted nucleic acid-binding protein
VKLVLDACVLYPTGLRGLFLTLARDGLFEPIWSPRILDEWYHAAAKLGPVAQAQVETEIAVLRTAWPHSEVQGEHLEVELPDPNDVHVVQTAIAAKSDTIITLNLRDFPARKLTEFGVVARHPDEYLYRCLPDDQAHIMQACEGERSKAEAAAGTEISLTKFLKKSRLNRLAKALKN